MKAYIRHPGTGLIVSSEGEVFIPKNRGHVAHWTFGTKHHTGYLVIRFNRKDYRVHRLVAETFLPNPANKPVIDHINRDTSDNRVENLRWASLSENRRNRSDYYRIEAEGRTHSCDDLKAYRREKRRIRRARCRPSDRHWPLQK